MKYQKEIAMLQSKLKDTMIELEEMKRGKVSMQNQLKRAFMKGLCAMNLEAMDVLDLKDIENGSGISNQKILNEENEINYSMGITQFGDQQRIIQEKKQIEFLRNLENKRAQNSQNDTNNFYRGDRRELSEKIDFNSGLERTKNEIFVKEDFSKEKAYEYTISELSKHIRPETENNYTSYTKEPFKREEEENPIDLNNLQNLSSKELDEVFSNYVKNMDKEKNIGGELVTQKTSSVVVLQQPAPESKEHLWRQAPIVGRRDQFEAQRVEEDEGQVLDFKKQIDQMKEPRPKKVRFR